MELEKKSDQSLGLLAQAVPFGKYILVGRIGKGGMAEVFLARPGNQRRMVAIKCIRKALLGDPQFMEMFIREGNLAIQLNHDAIVKTYEIGRVQGIPFICMEYLSGVDLSLILRHCRHNPKLRLPVPHTLFIGLRICEGLHYAHELMDTTGKSLSLVNRDVSPSNVRISFEGDVKLLDFGIAKATSGLSSEIGVLKGKISYMSPEQVRSLPLDRRSDIFSTGIVLLEMLTREKLFRADSEFQLMDLVRRAEISPPSSINPRVPQEVDALVIKALQKAPENRFQNAEEMATILRDVLARYNFSKTELRDLVRDICRDEWNREQKIVETCLSGEISKITPSQDADGDYGEFMEFAIENTIPFPSAAPPKRRSSSWWMYSILALSLLLLLTALLILFFRSGV